MMNKFREKLITVVAMGLLGGVAGLIAATGTNLGRVYTQPIMSDGMTASTAAINATRYAQRVGQDGLLVARFELGTETQTVDLVGCTVPKGAILLGDAVIEVTTAVNPTDCTNLIAVGGVTILANGVTLATTGIKTTTLATTQGMTTSEDVPYITFLVTGTVPTSGVFTLYMPYIQGTAWE